MAQAVSTGFVKYNGPRQLRDDEKLQDLNHWRDLFISYYKRDKASAYFLKPGVTWDPTHVTYNIRPAETGDGARSAAELHQDLLLFLSNLAGFLPWDYVSEQIKDETKCLQDCWDHIYDLYDAKVGTDTFLNYSTIKRATGETYRCLYERMCGQIRQHLPQGDLTIKGVKTGTGEKMTVTLYNLIALNWLDKIHPSLKDIVRKEYANQFADGKHLCELVSVIAPQVDGMLQRHEIKSVVVNKVSDNTPTEVRRVYNEDEIEEEVEDQIRWIKNFKRDGNKGTRGKGRRGERNKTFEACEYCVNLKKNVRQDRAKKIDVNHDSKTCHRRHYSIRLMEAIENAEENSEDEGKISENLPKPSITILQIEKEKPARDAEKICSQNCSQIKQIQKPSFNNEDISELSEERSLELLSAVRRIVSNTVAKADSPSLLGEIRGNPTVVIFDEGAQLNVLDDKYARSLGLEIRSSLQKANAANKTPMRITGQTEKDVTVVFNSKTGVVEINLGKVITVSDLGTKILVGEPGKRDNNIVTLPTEKLIEFRNTKNNITMPYHSSKKGKNDYMLARIQRSTTLQPGESVDVPLNEEMTDRNLAITPRSGVEWLRPEIKEAKGGAVELYNTSESVVKLNKGDQIADIRSCLTTEPPQLRRIYDRVADDFKYTDFSTTKDNHDEHIKAVQIDPDGILTPEEREMFREVTEHYKKVFTPRPGKYNGYFGEFSNRLNFASLPPQNTRIYTPNYSPEMKKILAEKLDKLVEWGVLVRPEEYNIQVEKISASLIVPKHEPGEFRVVTDFTGVNTHLKKIPSLSPTIAECRQSLARAGYVIMMDLSNYFYQGGVVAEDAQYLATMHPFKGVLVYSCMPQGVKGASETSYEVIERIFGDMVQEDRLATMADGIYPKGKTVMETLDSYAEVLRRASLSGLTFKPSKTIICPLKAELFGWDLDGGKWKPTVHTKTTLASYERPKTAKQLRSYLGAWKQMSSCISNYAVLLHPLEQLIAGKASKEWLTWTEEAAEAFDKSREAAKGVDGVYEARPTDVIHTYSDFSASNRAIGGRMILHRRNDTTGETDILLGGHFSATLDKFKKNWLACEGEAAGIRLTLAHFGPQIRASHHDVTHHTDSKPCVQAWGKMKKGAYSSSSRIATFLTDLSAMSVDLVYTPGKEMFTSDFASRHPPTCNSIKCQVCKFVSEWEQLGDNAREIRALTIEDIQRGRSTMPFTQRRVLHDIQHNDSMHCKLRELIRLGHLPDKRKTGGENTKLKLLHNMFQNGKLKVDKDGVVVIKEDNGHYSGYVVSLPQNIFRGFANALHVRLDHPSRGQLGSLLKRYFYTTGAQDIISEVSSSCQHCVSVRVLPKVLTEDTSSKPECFGSNFAADVIEMNAQNLFIIRESLSQFTQGIIIPDQRATTLEEAIMRTVLELIPDNGTTIRVDGAKAFQSLKISSDEDESYLAKYNIKLDIGRTLNRNKNPQAENANKEVEKEILRIWPNGKFMNNIDMAMVMKNVNSRIRYNGHAPKEILLRRDLISHQEKSIVDNEVITSQAENRAANSQHQSKHLEKTRKKSPAQTFQVGQLVFVRSLLTKSKARELYIVEEVKQADPIIYVIRKATGKLRRTTYEALEDELIAAPGGNSSTDSSEMITASEGELHTGPLSEENTVDTTASEGELHKGPLSEESEETSGEIENNETKDDETATATSKSSDSSSNDYKLNFKNLPRRQAALRAHKRAAWNRAILIPTATARHGAIQDDDEDFNFVHEMKHLVPRLAEMRLDQDDIIESDPNSDMDIDSSAGGRENSQMEISGQDIEQSRSPVNKNVSNDKEVSHHAAGKNSDEVDRSKGAISKKRDGPTIEKIIPTQIFKRSYDQHQQHATKNGQGQMTRAGSPSSTRAGRRIDPNKVGNFDDILERIQQRERTETRPSRSSAKKPEGHYKNLHSRGRDF